MKKLIFWLGMTTLMVALFILLDARHNARADTKPNQNFTITAITDGDTLKAGKISLRLYGIDAPELKQKCKNKKNRNYKCGINAKKYLTKLTPIGTILNCKTLFTDRYRRLMVTCKNTKGQDIAQKMIQAGWAITYGNKMYSNDEKIAKRKKHGIWKGKFETPKKWRDKN